MKELNNSWCGKVFFHHIMIFTLCFATILYAFLLSLNTSFFTLWSLMYTMVLCFIFVIYYELKATSIIWVLMILMVIHLSFMVSYLLFSLPENWFFSVDAYNQHLPRALAVVGFLNGDTSWASIADEYMYSVTVKMYLNSIFYGVFIYLFGYSPVTIMLVQLVFKCVTVTYLYKLIDKMFGEKKIALIGSLMYVLSPSIIYYTLTTYKETEVQLLVTLFMYNFYQFVARRRVVNIISMIVILLLFFNERFYFIFLFASAPLMYYFVHSRIWFKIIVVFFGVVAISFFLNIYFGSFQGMIDFFKGSLLGYSANTEGTLRHTNGALDFFRIVFTPFLTLGKVESWDTINGLLVYNMLIHACVMFLFIYGYMLTRKDMLNKSIHYMVFPLLLFYILFSLLAPFNGRVRDSFFPLFTVFASYALWWLRHRWAGSFVVGRVYGK